MILLHIVLDKLNSKIMQPKFYSLLLFAFVINILPMHAQWCTPETAIPYNANMPGITHFMLNTIDRESSDLENYPNNSFVNTGMSTTLLKGEQYSASITHTIDATICDDMNLRIWIDFNQDGDFVDIDETVLSEDHHEVGTFEDSFIIPMTALSGVTKMRVTAKMSSNGGHILPTPCDLPADPFGYHGEFEDYDVIISSETGINNAEHVVSAIKLCPNPAINSFSIKLQNINTQIDGYIIYNINGNAVVENTKIISGGKNIISDIDISALSEGVYFVKIIYENNFETYPLIVAK